MLQIDKFLVWPCHSAFFYFLFRANFPKLHGGLGGLLVFSCKVSAPLYLSIYIVMPIFPNGQKATQGQALCELPVPRTVPAARCAKSAAESMRKPTPATVLSQTLNTEITSKVFQFLG